MSLVLAFSRRPDASLRDIVRTGAVDLLQLPIEDKELAEAVERAIELAGAAPAAVAAAQAAAGRRPRAAAGGPGTVYTIASATGGCGKTFYATNLAYFLTRYTRQPGVHRRPRPAVRRGVHRPAPAAEVHDLRRPPARGHRRGRPAGPHRGVLRRPRDRRQRARRPAGARPRPTASTRPTSPASSRPSATASTTSSSTRRRRSPRRCSPPSTCPTCST